MDEETYAQGAITVPLRFYHNSRESRRKQPEWSRRIRATLDLLPPAHLALFQTNGDGGVEIKPRPRRGGIFAYTGRRFGDGRISLKNFVRVGFHAMEARANRQYVYTFLHEMGHLVDHWEYARGEASRSRCANQLYQSHPIECLIEVGRGQRRAHRREATWRCAGTECARWDRELTARMTSNGGSLARSRTDLQILRYEGLFHTHPFRGVARRGIAQRFRPPLPRLDSSVWRLPRAPGVNNQGADGGGSSSPHADL